MMRLDDYLERIAFNDTPRADLATLCGLLAAQITTVPFENLDVQLGRTLGTSPEAAWDKIVAQGRGGWCYEQNAVLQSALAMLGFPVRRIACGVKREEGTTDSIGGHLALIVEAEGRQWLADAGFGSKLAAPLPLEEGQRDDAPFTVSLHKLADGYWRFTEQGCGADPFWFDFLENPADEDLLAAKCRWQCTSPASNFVGRLTVQIRDGERHLALRDRTLTVSGRTGPQMRTIEDFGEWSDLLAATFRIPLDPVPLWEIVQQRQENVSEARSIARNSRSAAGVSRPGTVR